MASNTVRNPPPSSSGRSDHLALPIETAQSERSVASTIAHAEAKVKVNYDLREITQKGFNSLAVMSIFMASVQAQVVSGTLQNNGTIPQKLVNGFWLAGLSLDVYVTMLAALTERWFAILTPTDAAYLTRSWLDPDPAAHRAEDTELMPPNDRRAVSRLEKRLRNRKGAQHWVSWAVATGLFAGMPTLAAGFICFIAGLFVYVWSEQPLLVSIIATIPLAVMIPFVGAILLLRNETRMKNMIIDILRDKRGAW